MEARSRTLGFGFPGYDGYFPKATRSSRGRGGDQAVRKPVEGSELPKEMCFFELLATVAGQLLQEQNEESLDARPVMDLEVPKEDVKSVLKKTATYDIAAHQEIGSKTAFPKKGETIKINQNLKQADHKMEASYEPSAVSCLDNLDPTLLQEQDSKPFRSPVKAYASRKRRNAGTFCSRTPSSIASTGRHNKTESGETVFSQCKSKQEAAMKAPSRLLSLCSVDLKDGSVDLKETILSKQEQPVVNRQFHQIDTLMHVPFQVDAESPPLVSSGSSEETPFPTEPKSYSTNAFESSRQDTGSDEFSHWKSVEDEGNSSESTVPNDVVTTSLNLSYMRAMKARKCPNSSAKKRASTMGSKRKRHEMEDGVRGLTDATAKPRLGKKANKLPPRKDDVEQSKFTPLSLSVDSEIQQRVHESSVKLEREKISGPPMSLGSSSTVPEEDSNVTLSIKSFMVPELMVNLPESATVANLKRAVMEAAMNLLGGGLGVRVLLQGKKVTDETESLLKAGISRGGKLDSLGFMLEPNPVPASTTSNEDLFLVLSRGAKDTPSRYPTLSKGSEVNTGSFHVSACEGMLEIDANNSGTEMHSTTVSPSKEVTHVHDPDGMVPPSSCALVLHSRETNNGSNGLTIVPFGHNPGNIGINKRRIRRPFSVGEVEVLVHAVEKLGTGRWRDVKLHAFPQAKHRTYVDLKDKWKTLVHTASIAPHQRRGEPVPQGLLDRVIQAHSYWTAQQAKQQTMGTKVF